MAQISLRVDDDVKRGAEQTFDEIGLSMSTAINIFLKKVAREIRVVIKTTCEPRGRQTEYGESQVQHLKSRVVRPDYFYFILFCRIVH